MAQAFDRALPWGGELARLPDMEVFEYPTGMVWCPMKRSGIAIMRCAQLQKEHGCGSMRQWSVANRQPLNAPAGRADGVGLTVEELRLRKCELQVTSNEPWPWLRRQGRCPQRASAQEIRELRRVLTPLKLIEHSRKNPKAYRCPKCGGRKAFGARQCRKCWLVAVTKTLAPIATRTLSRRQNLSDVR